MDRECPRCGSTYRQYSTTQTICGRCYTKRAASKPSKARTPLPRSQKPLRRSTKPIRQYGKVQKKDAVFREKVIRPYLDKKFGLGCANCGVLPPVLDDWTYSRHAIDHINGKGPHPDERLVVTNFQYLCVPCHEKKTGTVRWNLKQTAEDLRARETAVNERRSTLTQNQVEERIYSAMDASLEELGQRLEDD